MVEMLREATRTSDDGALMTCPRQAVFPKLSLSSWAQAHEYHLDVVLLSNPSPASSLLVKIAPISDLLALNAYLQALAQVS